MNLGALGTLEIRGSRGRIGAEEQAGAEVGLGLVPRPSCPRSFLMLAGTRVATEANRNAGAQASGKATAPCFNSTTQISKTAPTLNNVTRLGLPAPWNGFQANDRSKRASERASDRRIHRSVGRSVVRSNEPSKQASKEQLEVEWQDSNDE